MASLIPGLPDDISALILSYIPLPFHVRLKFTCKSWCSFFSSKTLIFSLRHSHLPRSRLSHFLCIFPEDPSLSSPYLFDAAHLAWITLPPMPINPHVYSLCNFSAVSIGPHLYVIGGSLFDTRSFPMDRPSPTSAVFRFDLATGRWDSLSSMLTPRGSFACAVAKDGSQIVVAGGGSRHAMFGAAGSRMGSAERYDVEKDEWVPLPGLPGFRAGCVGFCVRREFWVMGGYGESRTIYGVLPVDEYYRDAALLELDGEWRQIGHMWQNGERAQLGKVVVVDDDDEEEEEGGNVPEIFMLDGNEILRYNMPLNRWLKESTIPRQAPDGSAFGFVSLNGELYIISYHQGFELSEIRRSRQRRKRSVLYMQIYSPRKRSWRCLVTRAPFKGPRDIGTTVICTIHV